MNLIHQKSRVSDLDTLRYLLMTLNNAGRDARAAVCV